MQTGPKRRRRRRRYEIQQWLCFIVPPANTFCWGNHHLQTCHTTTLCSLKAVSTFTNPVLHHIWLCSITLKDRKILFRAAIKIGICSINLYCKEQHCYLVKFNCPIINHNSTFITSKAVPLIRSSYFKNHDTSAGEEDSHHFQTLCCQYLPVCILILRFHILQIWTSLSPLSYYNGFHRTQNK
jgi:hypothetical protein